jgi:hypothetical protein
MSDWTVTTLKEHFEDLLKERDKRNESEFRGLAKAVELAASEADKKNVELNDVRLRFIPREVFEDYKAEQVARGRAMIVTFVVMGLTIVGLILQILR